MPPRIDSPVTLPNPLEPHTSEALDDTFNGFEAFCQSQIYRVKRELEALPTIRPGVNVGGAVHAVGRRKPSLSQVELEGQPRPSSSIGELRDK